MPRCDWMKPKSVRSRFQGTAQEQQPQSKNLDSFPRDCRSFIREAQKKKRAAAFRRRRVNFSAANRRLEVELFIQDDLAALNNDNLGGREGDVRDRGRPVIIWATGCLCRRIRRRRSRQARAKI